jgi:hypothetical protein
LLCPANSVDRGLAPPYLYGLKGAGTALKYFKITLDRNVVTLYALSNYKKEIIKNIGG